MAIMALTGVLNRSIRRNAASRSSTVDISLARSRRPGSVALIRLSSLLFMSVQFPNIVRGSHSTMFGNAIRTTVKTSINAA